MIYVGKRLIGMFICAVFVRMQKYPVLRVVKSTSKVVLTLACHCWVHRIGELFFSLHDVAALLSAFLCLQMNVQIPWLRCSKRAPVLGKVEWFIRKSSFYHDKQFGIRTCSCLLE